MKIATQFVLAAVLATSLHAAAPIERIARQFLGNFTANRFDLASADFNPDLRVTVTPAILAKTKAQIDRDLGSLIDTKEVHTTVENGMRVVQIRAKYEKSIAIVRVAFDATDHVASIGFNPEKVAPPDRALESMARDLLKEFNSGHYDALGVRFDAALRAQLPPTRLAELGKQIVDAYGLFRSVTDVRSKTEGEFKVVELVTIYDRAAVTVRVVFDKQKRVAGLKFAPT